MAQTQFNTWSSRLQGIEQKKMEEVKAENGPLLVYNFASFKDWAGGRAKPAGKADVMAGSKRSWVEVQVNRGDLNKSAS